MANNFVIAVAGSPVTGFLVSGPYDGEREAAKYGFSPGAFCWLLPLEPLAVPPTSCAIEWTAADWREWGGAYVAVTGSLTKGWRLVGPFLDPQRIEIEAPYAAIRTAPVGCDPM
jgi:hypothetical protein